MPEIQVRRLPVFIVVSSALLIYGMDQTIVATALDILQRDFHTSVTWVGWTITVYALGQILVLPVAGRLATQYGRRRIFIASLVLFSVASLGCGLANNILVLIIMRGLEAIGGAGFTPSATGIVAERFGPARDRAIGLFGSIFPIGAMVGPILGGIFVAFWTWRGIFLINLPLGAVLVVLAIRFIPSDPARPRASDGRADLVGMMQLGFGTLATMAGVSYLGAVNSRIASPLFVLPVVLGAASLAAFWRHVQRVQSPFIPARFLRGRGFAAMNSINLLWGGITLGVGALVPLYATERYGLGVVASGTLLTTRGLTTIVLSTLAAWALRHTGYRSPMYVGFLFGGVGMLAMASYPQYFSAYAWLSLAAGATGIGAGWSNPATRNAGLQLAPDQSATIAALRSMGMQTGSVVSISVATAVLATASNQRFAFAAIFAIAGALTIASMPLIRRVPEHHGPW